MIRREKIQWIEKELANTGPSFNRTKLYKVLKDGLKKLGYWKNRPRGKVSENFINQQKRFQ